MSPENLRSIECKKGLISVILPAYKADKYILQALESVAAQTYSSWEVVAVDDGGNVTAEESLKKFAVKVSGHRVKWLTHETNRGLAAARNTAILNAGGEFLAFLDHDDVWKAQYLESSVKSLYKESADVAYASTFLFDEKMEVKLGMYGPQSKEIETFPVSLYYRNYITPSAVVMRKSVVQKTGLFDTRFFSCEDYDYWIRMVRAGCVFTYVNEMYCLRRLHETQMTKNFKSLTEQKIRVIRRHRYWRILPIKDRIAREAALLNELADMCKEDSLVKGLKLILCAWAIEPFKFRHAKKALSILRLLARRLRAKCIATIGIR